MAIVDDEVVDDRGSDNRAMDDRSTNDGAAHDKLLTMMLLITGARMTAAIYDNVAKNRATDNGRCRLWGHGQYMLP